jgi:hypothetical protein
MKHELLSTRWEGLDLVLRRNGETVDCISAADIQRVILVCHGGDTPADLEFAVIETAPIMSCCHPTAALLAACTSSASRTGPSVAASTG